MQPELIITPFGESADPATVRDIPQSNPSGAPRQNASWEQGFPLITMTPIAAGGIPPEGPDMNGVLRAISRHASFVGGGGQYKWSAEYVAAKGGYPKGAVIQADNGEVSYVSMEENNSTNFNAYPDSIGKQWVFFGGATSYFELQFEQEQEKRENEFNQFLINTAFEMPPIPFVDGSLLEISRPTQLVSHEGQLYSVKLPATFPVVLSGVWDVAVVSLTPRSDESLRQQLATQGTDLIAFNRTMMADAVSTASRMLSAQLINIWEYVHLVTSKPTLDPNSWDWTEAHLAAIAACNIWPRRGLRYPPGIYLTTKTLDYGVLYVEGGGQDSGKGTVVRAATEGMLLAKCNSACYIANMKFDGANKAYWNLLVEGNRPVLMKVESVYAKEYGFVFWRTQNGSFFALSSYFCLYSFGFFNGARNLNFFGCGSATSSGPTGTRDPNQVELVFDHDTSDPHGFGVSKEVWINGNDRIAFFGGIFEYPATIISMRNTAASPYDVGRVYFYSTEFASGGIILDTEKLAATSNPKLYFNNIEATWYDQVTPFGRGTRGEIEFQGHVSFSGGAQIPNHGISQANNLDTRGIRVQDGTTYIGPNREITTVPKNGFSRPATTGAIAGSVAFTSGQKEIFFTTDNGAAFVGGTSYRNVKGNIPEGLSYALTAGINKTGAYTPSGPNPFPEGVSMLVENLGNGASDASVLAFRVRSAGGNGFGYLGITANRMMFGVRNNAEYQERLAISSPAGHITPGSDNQQNLGSPSARFAVVYAGTGAINTSDERLKCDIRDVSEIEHSVGIKLKKAIKAFRFDDAVEIKGDGARIHFGVIAQEVEQIFASEGLDAFEYGILCYDKWDAEYEDVCEEVPIMVDGEPLLDEDGNPCMEGRPTGEKRLVKEAGDRYGVRENEIYALILSST